VADRAGEFQRAVRLHQEGKLTNAEAIYRGLDQNDANVLQLLGVLLFQTGREAEGEALLEQAIKFDPNHAEALANLGVLRHEQGRYAEALEYLNRVLAIQRSNLDVLNKRGFVLQDLGRHGEAAATLRLAVEEEPRFAEAWFNLGNSLRELGDLEEAEAAFRKAIALQPANTDALTNLSGVLYSKRAFEEAAQMAMKSIQIRPTADAYLNLANAKSALGQTQASLGAAKTAAMLEPKDPRNHLVLGMLLHAQKHLPEALASYRKAASLDPNDGNILVRLGAALNQDGRYDEALQVLSSIPEPSDGMLFARALLVPPIPRDVQEIEDARERVMRELDSLLDSNLEVQDPANEISITNFYWSYHSKGELEMQKKAVELYLKSCPKLAWESPYLAEPRSGKLRIGVVSAFLNQHTIGKLFLRLISGLKDDEFEVVNFDCARKIDGWTRELNSKVDAAYKLIPDLESSREFIAEQNLDALFFPEIGMDPFTYYLAFSRLAPLQFMTWGHPVSTAIPTMDCFLSSEGLEQSGSERQYAERLVKFKELMTVFTRPETTPIGRAELGLPENRRLYVCAQALFKLHPDFVQSVAEVLRRDEKGLLVHVTGNEKHWDELVMERYRKLTPDIADRVVILGRLSLNEYVALQKAADAVLDTFYFGGGNSSLEAFSAGAPIVTLPGEMLRGRITLAQYSAMGFHDLVATDPNDYVQKALRLANDEQWRRAMSEKVLERCPVLFDNQKPIQELKNWLRTEIKR
jgi:protein O-GlcNAc transferase